MAFLVKMMHDNAIKNTLMFVVFELVFIWLFGLSFRGHKCS